MSQDFYDALETRDAAERESALMAALPGLVAHAQQNTRAFAGRLADIDPQRIASRAALATLPVTRKQDLLAAQQALRRAGDTDAFGGYAALRRPAKVFQSPGPMYEPEGQGADYWRMARALYAAGFRTGELVHNSFSYHLTPAGSMMEAGALALGCTVFPAGVGNTELQLQAVADLRPQAYVGTPSFLRILLEKAAGPTSITKALLSGEAFPASLRDWLAERGTVGYQCYATADLGLIAYETAAREGLVIDEGVIVEIVRPGSGEPLPDGEVGELVVTTLTRDYPLIRLGTGDLSAILPGACPTGRSNRRIRGWLGRADNQSAKVRGMFVHAGQVAEVMRRFPELGRARLVVEGEMANDRMTLKVEVSGVPTEGLFERIALALRDVTKLRAEIEFCAAGQLPNDGRLIEDLRRLD